MSITCGTSGTTARRGSGTGLCASLDYVEHDRPVAMLCDPGLELLVSQFPRTASRSHDPRLCLGPSAAAT